MSRRILLSASLLAADLSSTNITIRSLDGLVDMIHFDVMDGKFVPNITFGAKFISDLRPKSNLIFDAHLMIENPQNYITTFIKAGADIITLHYETSSNHLSELFNLIKINGKKIGLAINPSSPFDSIIHLLPKIDSLLIMTVNPGFCNQTFLSSQLDKIFQAKQYKTQHNLNYIIQVDGGINSHTAAQSIASGADCLVSGSYILNQDGIKITELTKLQKLIMI